MFMTREMDEIMMNHLNLVEKAQEKRKSGTLKNADAELENASENIKKLIEWRDLEIFAKGAIFGTLATFACVVISWLLS